MKRFPWITAFLLAVGPLAAQDFCPAPGGGVIVNYPSLPVLVGAPAMTCPAPTAPVTLTCPPSVSERRVTSSANRAAFFFYDIPEGAGLYVSNRERSLRITNQCDGVFVFQSSDLDREGSYHYRFSVAVPQRDGTWKTYVHDVSFRAGDRKTILWKDFRLPTAPQVIEQPTTRPRPPVAPTEETASRTVVAYDRDRGTLGRDDRLDVRTDATNARWTPVEKPPHVIEVRAGETARIDLRDKIGVRNATYYISDRAPEWMSVHPRGMLTLTPTASDEGTVIVPGSATESLPNEERIGLFKLRVVVKPR